MQTTMRRVLVFLYFGIIQLTSSCTIHLVQPISGSWSRFGDPISVEFEVTGHTHARRVCVVVNDISQCLPFTKRSQKIDISSLNVGSHEMSVYLEGNENEIIQTSEFVLVDVVPRKGGDYFDPIRRKKNKIKIKDSMYQKCKMSRYKNKYHRTEDLLRVVIGFDAINSASRSSGPKFRLGVLAYGTGIGGQEILDMDQLSILCKGSYPTRKLALCDPVYISLPPDENRLRELEARNLSHIPLDIPAFSSDDAIWRSTAHVLLNSRHSLEEMCSDRNKHGACNIASKLVSQLRRLDLDILIIPHHGSVDTLIGLHAARLANIKVRALEMPNIFDANHAHMCAAASVVIFPSCYAAYHELTAECRKSGTSIVVISPIGLDTTKTAQRNSCHDEQDNIFTVVYSSRLASERSVGMFLRTASILRYLTERSFEQFRFVLLGGGAQMETVRNLVTALNLDSFVEIRGMVSNQEIHRVLREEADAYLNTQFGETFGIGVIEAMFYGVPALVCDTGGPAENVEHEVTGIVVNCSHLENAFSIANEFASQLLELAFPYPESSGRYDRISRQAEIRARNMYSRDTFAVQYGSLYESLIWYDDE